MRVHPIWWLVGFSLFIGVANQLMKAPQESAVGDYATEVDKMITDITDIDAYGEMSWEPQYRAVILELDTLCTERLSEVINLSVEEIDNRRDGRQFALLNELEETLYLAKQAPQLPTACEPLIGR